MKKQILLLMGLSALALGSSQADMLELKSGDLIQGQFQGGSQNTVRFQVEGELKVYPVADILAITFTSAGAGGAAPAPAAAAAPAAAPAAPAPVAAPAPIAPATQSVSVPAGSRVVIRMMETVDSRKHKPGKKFTAKLEGDLKVGNVVVSPSGSTVYGRLSQAKQSGRLAGQSELVLELTDLTINGQMAPVVTESIGVKGQSTGRQTARRVGLATGIGAIAGGSDGAKKGAAIGGGVSVLTKGKSVNVPSGTFLEYRIMQPLNVNVAP